LNIFFMSVNKIFDKTYNFKSLVYVFVENRSFKLTFSIATYPFVHIIYWFKVKYSENSNYFCVSIFEKKKIYLSY
jgi:hypothetical protein